MSDSFAVTRRTRRTRITDVQILAELDAMGAEATATTIVEAYVRARERIGVRPRYGCGVRNHYLQNGPCADRVQRILKLLEARHAPGEDWRE